MNQDEKKEKIITGLKRVIEIVQQADHTTLNDFQESCGTHELVYGGQKHIFLDGNINIKIDIDLFDRSIRRKHLNERF